MNGNILDNNKLDKIFDAYVTHILDAKYDKWDPVKVTENRKHLTPKKQKYLTILLSKYTMLFDGTVGKYPHQQIHLEVDQNAIPVHTCPYAMAHAHHGVFEKGRNWSPSSFWHN
jgi:hypothetical protein